MSGVWGPAETYRGGKRRMGMCVCVSMGVGWYRRRFTDVWKCVRVGMRSEEWDGDDREEGNQGIGVGREVG